MIKSFSDKETSLLWEFGESRKLPPDIISRAIIKLAQLNNSATLQDLRIPPANYLEKLSGDREGQYSIRINNKYRLCFRFIEGDSYDVEICDYH